MTVAPLLWVPLLAVGEATDTVRAWEFDLPEAGWEWALYGGAFCLAAVFVIWISLRDTSPFAWWWRGLLLTLRLSVLGALAIIALNPQERTQKKSFRPSRVVLLADTSLSMRFPEATSGSVDASAASMSQGTRSEAVTALLSQSKLIEELRRTHDVSIYTFDSALEGPHQVLPINESSRPRDNDQVAVTESPAAAEPTVNWGQLLEAKGTESRLGEALLEVLREAGGRTLSGIVLFSDGASNAGVEPESAHDAAVTGKVRLVTVGVGSTKPPINLQLLSLQAPTDVHVGDPFELSAFVQAQGLEGREAQVELLVRPEGNASEQPTVVETRDVRLSGDGVPLDVRFRQSPTVAGEFEYYVRVKSGSALAELTTDDNERRRSISVIDRRTRVLLMAGGPMREYQFVRNVLYRHPAVEVDVWLQTVKPGERTAISQESDRLLVNFPSTPAELFEYDAIIAFDPDWKQIPTEGLQALKSWVGVHSGGLVVVAGDVYTPALAAAGNELQIVKELFPVYLLVDFQLEERSDQPWPVAFTREGTDAGFLQIRDDPADSAQQWKSFPGVYRAYPTAGAKAGATVYANYSDPRAQTEQGQPVLLASQFYGSGRTIYIGSGEIWRLRAVSDDLYERFWTKLVREAAIGRLQRGASLGMLLLERSQYVLGETVRVRAKLFTPQLAPLDVASVPVDIIDPAGRPVSTGTQLMRDANNPGQYVGDFRASLPGTYTIKVEAASGPDEGGSAPLRQEVTSRIDVALPNLEADNPRQDAKVLSDLARDTGGRYLQISEAAAAIPELLPNRGEELLINERLQTLWDRQWLLFLLVGILSIEWLTRKLLKLA